MAKLSTLTRYAHSEGDQSVTFLFDLDGENGQLELSCAPLKPDATVDPVAYYERRIRKFAEALQERIAAGKFVILG